MNNPVSSKENRNDKIPNPGVSREERISEEGLQRLENHLQNGSRMSLPVLKQWIKRHGDSARQLIKQYDQYHPDMD